MTTNLPTISLIAAVAQNRAIGRDGQLLWQLREDLQRFKLLTIGKPVIMGRKTFESIGKPLPERLNVVLTRDEAFAPTYEHHLMVVHSFAEAIAKATPNAVAGYGEIMIIGGGSIYAEALPLASKMYLTEVEDAPAGDAFFPEYDRAEWAEVQRLQRPGPPPFSFVDYVRRAVEP